MNSLLQDVVRQGTGRRAALPDGRAVAGKTGTTENYGDAWFVGYTPQLVTAVWVGYPNVLRPMLTEYHGDPVAGGTFPALIWRTFMERALKLRQDAPAELASAPYAYAAPKAVVVRNGELRIDNGYCKRVKTVWFFTGSGPGKVADCKRNEVEVPVLVGRKLAEAEARLAAQPLTPEPVYKWATAGQPIGVVLSQFPASGTLSSYQKVRLVVARPPHGVVPRVVGLPLRSARLKLQRKELDARVVRFTDGRPGQVVFQAPKGGVAAAPSMEIKLVVGR